MLDRSAILPLGLGLLLAVVAHLALAGEVARWTRADPSPPRDMPHALDLAVRSLDAPRLVEVAKPFQATAVVHNQGDRPAPESLLRWSLNADPLGQPDAVPPLPAAQTHRATRRLTLDKPGPHRLTVTADPDHALTDPDRANNRRTITLLAYAPASADQPRPDLVPIAIEPVGPLFAGQPARLLARIGNRGTAPAQNVVVELERDGMPIATAVLDQPIPPGRVATRRFKVQVDQTGPHELCLLLDPTQTVDELDESNNRRCFTLNWRSLSSRQPAGQTDPPEDLTVNWIGYDAFQDMLARQDAAQDQPLVQRSTEPTPTDRAPIRATPPAPQPTDDLPGIPDPRDNPTAEPNAPAPDAPTPRPSPPQPVLARTDRPDPADPAANPSPPLDAPDNPEPEHTPELPSLPTAETAAATREAAPDPAAPTEPTDAPAPMPRMVVLPDAAVAEPDDAAPDEAVEAMENALSNPPLAIDAMPTGRTVARTDEALPPSQRAAMSALPLPPAQLAPARATRPVQADDPDELDPAAMQFEPRPREPIAAPAPIDDAPPGEQRAPAAPESTADADADADADARPDPPDPTDRQPRRIDRPTDEPDPASATRPGGRTGRPANPTAAPRDRREAVPATRIPDLVVRPGQVLARQGIRINTVLPDFSVPARLTAVPRSPVYNVRFNHRGKVVDVQTLRSTGYASVDSPLVIAIYKWTAEGKIADDGFLLERLRIRFGNEDDTDDNNDAPPDNTNESP